MGYYFFLSALDILFFHLQQILTETVISQIQHTLKYERKRGLPNSQFKFQTFETIMNKIRIQRLKFRVFHSNSTR